MTAMTTSTPAGHKEGSHPDNNRTSLLNKCPSYATGNSTKKHQAQRYSLAERRDLCDPRALRIASALREVAGAEAAILFGSRARGDHRLDSDVDILLISDNPPPERTMRQLEEIASIAQKMAIPEAGGVDIGCMTPEEFHKKRPMLNSLPHRIAKDGVPAMPGENTGYGNEYAYDAEEEENYIDWQDVQDRLDEAMDSVKDLQHQMDDNGMVHTSDRNFGYMAQRSLECSYKAVLGSHGIEYPASGNDGHNLRKLVELMRDQFGSPVPGEQYIYLTEFGGAAWYAHEHRSLDKPVLARELPEAVQSIIALKKAPPVGC